MSKIIKKSKKKAKATIKGTKYIDVFKEAKKNSKYKQYCEEFLARIRLAEAIHRERTKQGLSMESLAQKAHTTPAVISRIENAQVSTGIDVIFKIYRALGKKKVEFLFA